MKTNSSRCTVVLAIAVLVLIAGIWHAVSPARASLGNSGMPVRCTPSGSSIPIGEARFFDCVAADGTSFTDGQRVPNGYYLLVTDVVVTSVDTATNAERRLILYDAFDADSRAYALELSSGFGDSGTVPSFGTHFTTPYMVLPAGHRLEGVNDAGSGGLLKVYASGLLVTNVSYLPLAMNN